MISIGLTELGRMTIIFYRFKSRYINEAHIVIYVHFELLIMDNWVITKHKAQKIGGLIGTPLFSCNK